MDEITDWRPRSHSTTSHASSARQDKWSDLWPLYAPIAEARGTFVLGQLGQSLDGRIATPTGHSRTIGGGEAIAHLHRLRAMVDAVVVGIGTVLKDDPQLTVRHCEGPSPVRVVIDPNGRLPADARILAEDGVDCIAVQACALDRPSRVTALALPSVNGRIEAHALVAALAARGLRRLLIEGGGRTVSAFVAAGALHRLHVCVSPVLIGSGPTGLCLPPIAHMAEARRPRCRTHRIGDDVLFDLDFT
ncbi:MULTISPECIES: RibD family protein [unclassified Acidisoma]|jgi:diaminohydroxyphosphoribosylaminopyrimidine deaminase/5-amino-6-(5-phosphoribosylamino)uracil reductase|uniref:RibD family protein n=1 Tax=unclassified Acidisoma TaxID=2634065 RepID=UPI001C205B9D|nr:MULTISPECIES: RibD family protein [unclassified Acidisoma]